MIDGDDVWMHNTLSPEYWYDDRTHQFSAGFDYSLNNKHAIGGQYQFYTSNGDVSSPISTSTHLNSEPYETSESQSYTEDNSRQHLVNAFYNGDFSDRFSLRLDFDYLKNYIHRDQQSDEVVNNADANRVEIFNLTDYDLYAGKLTNSWKPVFGLIELGGEYNNISGYGYVLSNHCTPRSISTKQLVSGTLITRWGRNGRFLNPCTTGNKLHTIKPAIFSGHTTISHCRMTLSCHAISFIKAMNNMPIS